MYLSFNRLNCTLYIYCVPDLEKEIREKIEKFLGDVKITSKIVSYLGVSLGMIESLFKKIQAENENNRHNKPDKNNHFSYEINYTNKTITIYQNLETIENTIELIQ